MTSLCGVCRELSRIDRFLRTNSELNAVHFDRKSSFNAFLRPFDQRVRKAVESPLKCVQNLWLFLQNKDEKTRQEFAERVNEIVAKVGADIAPNALPRLLVALFRCQTPGAQQSPFRALAVALLCASPLIHVTDVFLFCALIGRKGISSSRAVRHALRRFYGRDFDDLHVETMLVFGQQFVVSKDWSHRDVIRVAHIPSTDRVTRLLLRIDDDCDDTLTTAERRIRVLRSPESRLEDVLSALETTLLPPDLWMRALNTKWSRNAYVWRRLLEALPEDRFLAAIPQTISRFPNNRLLRRTLATRLAAIASTDSCFARQLSLYYCEKNHLKIDVNFMHRLRRALVSIATPDRRLRPLLVHIDPHLDTQRKYLAALQTKGRRKADLLDAMTIKDFLQVFAQSFHCFARVGGHFTRWESADTPTDADFAFADTPSEWRDCAVVWFAADAALENLESLALSSDRKLIVFSLNKRKESFGFFRTNVLVVNGMDARAEPLIAHFLFGEPEVNSCIVNKC
ncbi:unnamed protein product [Oppiella nova]|uniref:Uncharacterized protein n=1 Tax=Oppiella nova TaxID=334625 RepID=A0A7R9MIF7_9ACAR|nr:unnamed protein product [Oppiella nova]CAG2176799.1 unnamed protein product [Oppiella nova]